LISVPPSDDPRRVWGRWYPFQINIRAHPNTDPFAQLFAARITRFESSTGFLVSQMVSIRRHRAKKRHESGAQWSKYGLDLVIASGACPVPGATN
jgi:hypothetical protein